MRNTCARCVSKVCPENRLKQKLFHLPFFSLRVETVVFGRSSRIRRRLTRKKPKNGSRPSAGPGLIIFDRMGHRCFLPLNEQPTNPQCPTNTVQQWSTPGPNYAGCCRTGRTFANHGTLSQSRAASGNEWPARPAPSIAPFPWLQEKYPPSTVASGSEARKAPEPERSNTAAAGGVCLLPMATSAVAAAALLCPSQLFPAAVKPHA